MHAVESACRVESSEFVALVSQTNYTSHSYGSRDIELSSKEEAISELSKLLEEESKAPWTRILQLSALFLLVICLNLLKGGRSLLQWLPFEVPCGSIVSFALDIMNVSIILLFAKQVRGTLIDETSRKLTLSYRFVEGDVIWDETNTWKYSCICSFAGLFAGLFGIGKNERNTAKHVMLYIRALRCFAMLFYDLTLCFDSP